MGLDKGMDGRVTKLGKKIVNRLGVKGKKFRLGHTETEAVRHRRPQLRSEARPHIQVDDMRVEAVGVSVVKVGRLVMGCRS